MATEYKIALYRFDVNLLPPEARQVGTDALKTSATVSAATD